MRYAKDILTTPVRPDLHPRKLGVFPDHVTAAFAIDWAGNDVKEARAWHG